MLAAAAVLLAATPLSAAPIADLDAAHALDRLPPAEAEPRIHALLIEWLEREPAPGARAWVRAKRSWAPVHHRPLADGRGLLSVPAYPIASTASAVLTRWEMRSRAKSLTGAPSGPLDGLPTPAKVEWLRQAPDAQIVQIGDRLLASPGDQAESVLIALATRSTDPRALSAVARYGHSAAALRLLRASNASDDVLEAALANPALRAGTWALIGEQMANARPAWRERLLAAAADESAAAVSLRHLPDYRSILGAWLQSTDTQQQRAALLAAAGLPRAQRQALLAVFRDNPDASPDLLREIAQW